MDKEEWTLQALDKYIKSIPTKQDFEQYVCRLDTYKQELQSFKCDLQGGKVVDADHQFNDLSTWVADNHSAIKYVLHKEEKQAIHLEDIENRNHRNIRVRGVSENSSNTDLDATLQKIQFVHYHGPCQRPRDRFHCSKQKEAIMNAARLHMPVTGTLQLRRALKPLLYVFKEHNIANHRGYPFSLIANKKNRLAMFNRLGNFPNLLGTLNLPMLALPDWLKKTSLIGPSKILKVAGGP